MYIFEEISDNVITARKHSKTTQRQLKDKYNLIPSNYICTKFATLQSQGKLISVFATDFPMR